MKENINVIVILTEKPKMSALIARALVFRLHKGKQIELFRYFDHFEFHKYSEIGKNKSTNWHSYAGLFRNKYFNCKPVVFESFVRSRKNKRIELGSDKPETDLKGKAVEEKVIYYVIPDSNNSSLYVVTDTGGAGLSLKANLSVNEFLDTAAYERIINSAYLRPSLPHINKKNRVSIMKALLLKYIIVHRKMPCNDQLKNAQISIANILSATDYDVAGQYIFQSTIDYLSAYAKQIGYLEWEKFNRIITGRVELSSPQPENICKSIDSQLELDFGMASAGKLRAYFDNFFGVLCNNLLKSLSGDKSKKLYSIGRVQTLAIHSLFVLTEELKKQRYMLDTYIVYPFNKFAVEDSEQLKDACFIQIISIRSEISQSLFLERMRDLNVGTYTTRYKQISKLENSGLAKVNGSTISLTPAGEGFYSVINNLILCGQYGLLSLNNDLMKYMDHLTSIKNQEEALRCFDEFILILMDKVKKLLIYVSLNMERSAIDKRMCKAEGVGISEKDNELVDGSNKKSALDGDCHSLVAEETQSVVLENKYLPVPEDNVRKLHFDRPDSFNVVRVKSKGHEIQAIKSKLRRLLKIDMGVQFRISSVYNLRLVEENNDLDLLVYKGDINSHFNKKDINKMIENFDIERVKYLTELPMENIITNDAHDPIHITKFKRSYVKGPMGAALLSEYAMPWYYNNRLISNTDDVALNFSIRDKCYRDPSFLKKVYFKVTGKRLPNRVEYNFELVPLYGLGMVHNFESLLETMMNKYSLSFSECALLAEELYLSA